MKSGLLDGIREEKNVLEEKLKIEELRKDYEVCLAQQFCYQFVG